MITEYKFTTNDILGDLSLDMSNAQRPVFYQKGISHKDFTAGHSLATEIDSELVFFNINNTEIKLSTVNALDLNEWAKTKGYIKEEAAV